MTVHPLIKRLAISTTVVVAAICACATADNLWNHYHCPDEDAVSARLDSILHTGMSRSQVVRALNAADFPVRRTTHDQEMAVDVPQPCCHQFVVLSRVVILLHFNAQDRLNVYSVERFVTGP